MVKKIVGPVLWENFIVGYGSDSILYTYNTSNRISHITYYGSHESAGITTRYRLESDLTYDSKGNVQRITLQGDNGLLEKEISFRYDIDGNISNTKLIFRADGNLIRENDSVVITYYHKDYAISPSVINGHPIVNLVNASGDYYGNTEALKEYMRSWENNSFAYAYFLNKDNIPMQIWRSRYNVAAVMIDNYRYDVVDTNIVGVKTYLNDMSAQGAPFNIDTYERTAIPNVSFQITKSIFGKNFWISNIGMLSPLHTMEVSTFVKSINQGRPAALHFSFDVDSSAKIITQSYRDQYGVYQPLTKFYFY
ncbi:MAG TPA: hypothetical protein VGD17_05075 [Chitinophagaceae bacterium]